MGRGAPRVMIPHVFFGSINSLVLSLINGKALSGVFPLILPISLIFALFVLFLLLCFCCNNL